MGDGWTDGAALDYNKQEQKGEDLEASRTTRARMADVGRLGPQHVYIGTGSMQHGQRPSRWTYHIRPKPDESTAEYNKKYRAYRHSKPELVKDIHLLRGKTLVCQCKMGAP